MIKEASQSNSLLGKSLSKSYLTPEQSALTNLSQVELRNQKLEDCCVCGSGEYEEGIDHIVFCGVSSFCLIFQLCQKGVHQSCYGIEKIPKGEWICALCQIYQQQDHDMPCLACTQVGGLMRPTTKLRTKQKIAHPLSKTSNLLFNFLRCSDSLCKERKRLFLGKGVAIEKNSK